MTSVQDPVRVLHPGDVACLSRGGRFEILLGSCVAIILTDPRRTVAAACHIVHASAPRAGESRNGAYGSVALDTMQRLLVARGISPQLCEAYVAGGGNMFPALLKRDHVGEQNSRWALAALERAGVNVLGVDVGGNVYRRLSWAVGDGVPQVNAVAV